MLRLNKVANELSVLRDKHNMAREDLDVSKQLFSQIRIELDNAQGDLVEMRSEIELLKSQNKILFKSREEALSKLTSLEEHNKDLEHSSKYLTQSYYNLKSTSDLFESKLSEISEKTSTLSCGTLLKSDFDLFSKDFEKSLKMSKNRIDMVEKELRATDVYIERKLPIDLNMI